MGMPANQAAVDPNDPSNALNNALSEANSDILQYQFERARLFAEVAYMVKVLNEAVHDPMKAFQALQIAQTTVMPEMMQLKGGDVAKVSDGLNIASALRSYNTYLQQFFNEGKSITPEDAQKFATATNELWKALHDPNLSKFLGGSTDDSLVATLHTLYNAFGASDGNVNGTQIYNSMQKWFSTTNNFPNLPMAPFVFPFNGHNEPLGPDPLMRILPADSNDPSPAVDPHIAIIQGVFQQDGTSVSAISQTQQTLIQYDSNIYNQFMGALEQVYQAAKTLGMQMVQNQDKKSG